MLFVFMIVRVHACAWQLSCAALQTTAKMSHSSSQCKRLYANNRSVRDPRRSLPWGLFHGNLCTHFVYLYTYIYIQHTMYLHTSHWRCSLVSQVEQARALSNYSRFFCKQSATEWSIMSKILVRACLSVASTTFWKLWPLAVRTHSRES